jgi:hypothetical protein
MPSVWPYLPSPVAAVAQPGAFFVPRLITATEGFDDIVGARLQGRVLDWRGNGLSGVAVRALTEQGERSTLTRGDGTFAIDSLASGNYTVTVSGYDGIPVRPLQIDGQSIFIVEFMESARLETPTPLPSVTIRATPSATVAEARRAVSTPPPGGGSAGVAATPTRSTPRPTPAVKREPPVLAMADLDFLGELLVTPFLLGAAGGYIVFLIGIIGARLRR